MERWEIDTDSSLLPILEKAGDRAIDITRNGEVIGKIIPQSHHDRADAQAAVSRIMALKVDLKLSPGETIHDLIREGRKY